MVRVRALRDPGRAFQRVGVCVVVTVGACTAVWLQVSRPSPVGLVLALFLALCAVRFTWEALKAVRLLPLVTVRVDGVRLVVSTPLRGRRAAHGDFVRGAPIGMGGMSYPSGRLRRYAFRLVQGAASARVAGPLPPDGTDIARLVAMLAGVSTRLEVADVAREVPAFVSVRPDASPPFPVAAPGGVATVVAGGTWTFPGVEDGRATAQYAPPPPARGMKIAASHDFASRVRTLFVMGAGGEVASVLTVDPQAAGLDVYVGHDGSGAQWWHLRTESHAGPDLGAGSL